MPLTRTLQNLSREEQIARAHFLRTEFERMGTGGLTMEQKALLRRMANAVPLDADLYGPLDLYLKEHDA